MSDEVLMDIQRSLGRIEQKIDSHVQQFADHADEDTRRFTALFRAVDSVKTKQERQRGFIAGMTAAGTALGAGMAWLAEKMFLGHH